jgi:hypothetical protein
LEVDLGKQESFNVLSLVEPVGKWSDYGQSHIRSYRFLCWNGSEWITLNRGRITRSFDDSSHSARFISEGAAAPGKQSGPASHC